MVITARTVLGAAAIVCLFQGMKVAGQMPPPGLTWDLKSAVEEAVETLKSRTNALTDQLLHKSSAKVEDNGDPIKDALLVLKEDEEKFREMQTQLDPKYGNCSRDQMEAVELAFSATEEQLTGKCSALHNAALTNVVQQMLSFYSTDKSPIFDLCDDPTVNDIRQTIDCFKTTLRQIKKDLDDSEASMNDILLAASTKDKEETTSCVAASRSGLVKALEELGEDLYRCITEVDRDSPSIMMRRRWWKKNRKYVVAGVKLCIQFCGMFG